MAHVQIQQHPEHGEGSFQLLVDGVDLSMHVLADMRVEFPADDPFQKPVVRVAVVADTIDIDLPDAVVAALAVSDGEEAGA